MLLCCELMMASLVDPVFKFFDHTLFSALYQEFEEFLFGELPQVLVGNSTVGTPKCPSAKAIWILKNLELSKGYVSHLNVAGILNSLCQT